MPSALQSNLTPIRPHLTLVADESPQSPPPVLVAVPPLPEPCDLDLDEIPEPSPGFIRALAVRVFEVLDGTRSVRQLGPTISVGLARQLTVLRATREERRAVYRDTRRQVPQAMGVRLDRPCPEVTEAAVVLNTNQRAVAVALRLEWTHQHWRASEVTIL